MFLINKNGHEQLYIDIEHVFFETVTHFVCYKNDQKRKTNKGDLVEKQCKTHGGPKS